MDAFNPVDARKLALGANEEAVILLSFESDITQTWQIFLALTDDSAAHAAFELQLQGGYGASTEPVVTVGPGGTHVFTGCGPCQVVVSTGPNGGATVSGWIVPETNYGAIGPRSKYFQLLAPSPAINYVQVGYPPRFRNKLQIMWAQNPLAAAADVCRWYMRYDNTIIVGQGDIVHSLAGAPPANGILEMIHPPDGWLVLATINPGIAGDCLLTWTQ